MTIKEKIEENIVLSVLGILLTGFVSGFSAHAVLQQRADSPEPVSTSSSSWEDLASKAAWVPKSACPAYPLHIRLTSPGDQSTVVLNAGSSYAILETTFVVQISRTLPEANSIGLIVNEQQTSNFYVVFHEFYSKDRKFFRGERIYLPIGPSSGSKINIWAFIVDKRDGLGRVYANIDQIKSSGIDIILSDSIVIGIK